MNKMYSGYLKILNLINNLYTFLDRIIHLQYLYSLIKYYVYHFLIL